MLAALEKPDQSLRGKCEAPRTCHTKHIHRKLSRHAHNVSTQCVSAGALLGARVCERESSSLTKARERDLAVIEGGRDRREDAVCVCCCVCAVLL